MNVLGVWGYSADSAGPTHESGACVLQDGRLVAAINQERLSRKKGDGGYPFEAIEEAMRLAGITPRDLDAVGLAGLPPLRRAARMFASQWELWRDTGIVLPRRALYAILTAKQIRRTLPGALKGLRRTEWAHHHCHAAAAFFTSPLDRATVITLDGIGDSSTCGTMSSGEGTGLRLLSEFNGYYSPGILYSFITKVFGFRPARHEGKITGLAAYGNPDTCRDVFEQLLDYQTDRHRFFSRQIPYLFGPGSEDLWSIPLISDLLNTLEHKDIAAGLQAVLETRVTAMVRDAIRQTGIPDVALAGGVFANVKVNQRIREMPEVGNVYVHPGMGDEGLMVGAAYLAAIDATGDRTGFERHFLDNVYLGPSADRNAIHNAAAGPGLHVEPVDDVEDRVAALLAAGKIVGRFNGRMEYGPRALGNRSILADPTDPEINNWLNQRLKRTEFMPFAPSVMEEHAGEYFMGWTPDQVAARFMTMTYDVVPERRNDCGAVVHVDGTARPQVLRREDNPSFHRILDAYHRRTGRPLLVNTSFNIHEEPIVCTSEDAIRAFTAGSVDVLAIEDCLVTR
jgi:carbamoyltransferase